jgi:hypothetical protein
MASTSLTPTSGKRNEEQDSAGMGAGQEVRTGLCIEAQCQAHHSEIQLVVEAECPIHRLELMEEPLD